MRYIARSLADKEGDKKSQKILQELENIDDECEEKEIDFVKISDEGIEKEYDLPGLPALAFYRHKFRQIYSGDMMHEEEILEWVLDLRTTTPDVIESVDRKTLQVLINDVEHLAVFFCEYPHVLHLLKKIRRKSRDFNINYDVRQTMTSANPARRFSRN